MPTIRVTVKRDGKPVRDHRVSLGCKGILSGGVYGPKYTDSRGIAEFDVEYGQGGEVYVDGRECGRWGSYTARSVTVSL